MLDLEPIKARLAAATPGPWESARASAWANGQRETTEWFVRRPEDDVAIAADVIDPETSEASEANSEFIANAPTDIAALVAEVERLRAERSL